METASIKTVEKKVLEMSQHASFHQHVSYNLSTILHALTAGKTDPAKIAEAFSRAKGLEVITRVISGEPVARPAVVSLSCSVARRVVDKFGEGVTEDQARGLVEALVHRLDLGISGDDAQTVECQVECASLISSVAGRNASTLLSGGALGAIEGLLERLAPHRSASISVVSSDSQSPGPAEEGSSSVSSRRSRPSLHVRVPSCPFYGTGPERPLWNSGAWGPRSILQPCSEAIERVSRSPEGRALLEGRGAAGVLLATIRSCPEAREEGSDVALAYALKAVERMLTGKSPEQCAGLLVRCSAPPPPSPGEDDAGSDEPLPGPDGCIAECMETLLNVTETAPDTPGRIAAMCLWWAAGAGADTSGQRMGKVLSASLGRVGEAVDLEGSEEEGAAGATTADDWARLLRIPGEDESGEDAPIAPRLRRDACRLLAALCLSKPGLKAVEEKLGAEPQEAVQVLVEACGASEPRLASACLRIVERLAGSDFGGGQFVDAGVLDAGVKTGEKFEGGEGIEGQEDYLIGDTEAYALAAALGMSAALAELASKSALEVIDRGFRLAVRSLEEVAEFSGRPSAAVGKAALDMITFRLTRPDRPQGRTGGIDGVIPPLLKSDSSRASDGGVDAGGDEGPGLWGVAQNGVDAPMEVLRDGSMILSVMGAHPSDAKLQESGWRSLIAMDTGRGDVEKFFAGGDGQERGREILKDCIERHGGDGAVAGQVAAMLERLVLEDDSDGAHTSLASTPTEDMEANDRSTHFDAREGDGDPEGQSNSVPDEGGGDVPEPPPEVSGTPDHHDADPEDEEKPGEAIEADTEKSAELADAGPGEEPPCEGEGEPPAGENGDSGGDGDGDAPEPPPPGVSGTPDHHDADPEDAEKLVEAVEADTEKSEEPTDAGPADEPPGEGEGEPPPEENGDSGGAGGDDGDGAAEVALPTEEVEEKDGENVEGEHQQPPPPSSPDVDDSGGEADTTIAAAVETGAMATADATGASAAETGTAESESSEPAELGSPEEVLQRLTSVGRLALSDENDDDGDYDDNESPFDTLKSGGSAGEKSLPRFLFQEESDGVEEEEPSREPNGKPSEETSEEAKEPSPAEIHLQKSWEDLEKLYGDVTGRSQILGGDNAEVVAVMKDPAELRRLVDASMGGPGGETPSRAGVAASHLAMVDALAAATGALASSQKEIQRFLTMSRDLRGTSTWKEMEEAMKWTMDSLKGTVILFGPHTSQNLTKDLVICKNAEAASKLFKEAALNIKIVVVELAGEHAPNTVWRIAPGQFEALPTNRKLMMLRHLRSLVVAYDHLPEMNRRDYTTALEIIKNREVLNKMGKACVEAEMLEEQRREAKLARDEERLRIGRRSGTRTSTRRSQSPATRPPTDTSRTSPNGTSSSRSLYSPVPPAGPNSPSGMYLSPGDKHPGRPRSVRSSGSSECGTPAHGSNDGSGGGSVSRGIVTRSRQRERVASAGSPGSALRTSSSPVRGMRSKSPVPRQRSKSPAIRERSKSSAQAPRSRSPVPRTRSRSPPRVTRTRSRSPVPARPPDKPPSTSSLEADARAPFR